MCSGVSTRSHSQISTCRVFIPFRKMTPWTYNRHTGIGWISWKPELDHRHPKLPIQYAQFVPQISSFFNVFLLSSHPQKISVLGPRVFSFSIVYSCSPIFLPVRDLVGFDRGSNAIVVVRQYLRACEASHASGLSSPWTVMKHSLISSCIIVRRNFKSVRKFRSSAPSILRIFRAIRKSPALIKSSRSLRADNFLNPYN